MRIPGFNAESSIPSTSNGFRAKAFSGTSGSASVMPMLDNAYCGNCETVGGFGRIRGVGRRSCCRDTWVRDASGRLVRSTRCWFESCSGEASSGGLLSF